MPIEKRKSKSRKSRRSRRSRKSKRQSRSSRKCPVGEVERVGFKRRSYSRRNGSRVDGSNVSSTCIRDVGRIGKGPYTLPKIKKADQRGEFFLSNQYNYSTSDIASKRHQALNKASNDWGTRRVERHLLLRANYNANSKAKERMYQDVDYLSQKYEKEQMARGKASSAYRRSSRGIEASRRKSRKISRLKMQERSRNRQSRNSRK